MGYIEDGKSKKQFICSDAKKNVFLIGDSIRQGYCALVREGLSDVAEVFYIDDNCRNTQYVISKLNVWSNMFSDRNRIDLVQFNCGHWDVAHWNGGKFSLTSETEYTRNLQIIIDMISELFPCAKIMFATTTTMNPSGQMGVNSRTNAEITRYNEMAQAVAGKNNVAVNDLFAVTKEWDTSYYRDYCHFTDEANVILAQAVSAVLKSFL